jgi:aerobic-type carbon monoxide dehydrogenase small subunit (CoxS/CutS family)
MDLGDTTGAQLLAELEASGIACPPRVVLITGDVENGAVQCGFCTPGMVLSSKSLLDQNPNPSEEEIKEALSGNLCRCTGYTKIIKAVTEAAKAANFGG